MERREYVWSKGSKVHLAGKAGSVRDLGQKVTDGQCKCVCQRGQEEMTVCSTPEFRRELT